MKNLNLGFSRKEVMAGLSHSCGTSRAVSGVSIVSMDHQQLPAEGPIVLCQHPRPSTLVPC